MMKFSKVLSLVLVVLMLLSVLLTSCGGNGNKIENTDDTNATQNTGDVVEESETEEKLAELEVEDLGGRVFKMLWPDYMDNEGHFRYSELGIAVGAEASRGDIIETAVYKRNEAVKIAYNAEIEVTTMKYSDITGLVSTEITSGAESTYDVVSTMNTKMSKLALEGFLVDFNDLQYYSEEQQWWNHELMQELSIVNRRYFGMGDIIYSDDLYPYVVYVNTGLAETVGITDNFYELVDNKQWTLEKFHTFAKLAVADYDNDGTPANSLQDGFGAVDGNSFARALYYSAGKSVITFDSQGYPVWQMEPAHAHSVLSKIIDMWHTGRAVVDVTKFEDGKKLKAMDIINMFNSNQMLFMPGDLKAAQAFTSVDNALEDFALLPIPLWDEYSDYVCVMNEAMVLSIPITVREQDEVGLILSAMGRASVDTLTPAFFEIVLTGRYMKNVDSVKTLELILDSIVPRDIADIQGWGDFMNQFCKLAIAGDENFSSYYEAHIGEARGKMDEYISELEKIDK